MELHVHGALRHPERLGPSRMGAPVYGDPPPPHGFPLLLVIVDVRPVSTTSFSTKSSELDSENIWGQFDSAGSATIPARSGLASMLRDN